MTVGEDNSAENEEAMDSDKDDSADDDFDSDSSSDDYDSSDLSFTEYEKLSDECSNSLNVLESQFYQLAEAYRKEKLSSLNSQLIELVEEKSSDYLVPVEELRENRDERIRIAGIVRDYRNKNAKQNYEADLSITEQDFQNEKLLLKDRIRAEIEEKIRQLNEDRHKADSDYISETNYSKRSRKYSGDHQGEKSSEPKRPRKPVTVNGPYVVYMLKDEEINEDVNYIKYNSRPPPPPTRSYSSNYTY